jgi:hypothetical protein
MIDRPAHLAALGLRLLEHAVENIGFDAEGDVQIKRILALELEWRAGDLEKREARAVIHLKKRMKRAAFVDLERTNQSQPEKILVKRPGLFRIPTAIGVMMQAFDHLILPFTRTY